MSDRIYRFHAQIQPVPEKGGAYIAVPFDIRKEFGKGRVKADITFDGEPYCGSIVNMGLRDERGRICYVLGLLKDIRAALGKGPGDTVHVVAARR